MANLIEDLSWRDMIHTTIPGTEDQLLRENTKGYLGIDSTAPSMHIGNLASLMLLVHLQRHGHTPYLLLGGATTRIGDPEGKAQERTLLSEYEIDYNKDKIEQQARKLLDFDTDINPAQIRDNYFWFKDFDMLTFLREVGKHMPLGYMLSKESVKQRLKTGISFAEFSYQVLQGYDFYHLYKEEDVKVQLGGSDQWGNLTSGTELIRRKAGGEAFAITTPLITKSDGSKFGKSEDGNIWLDPDMTSPYKFYQFWMNTSDQDSETLIKKFTFLEKDHIEELITEHKKNPHLRVLQHTLAKEVTIFIHSEEEYIKSEKAAKLLFSKSFLEDIHTINEETFLDSIEGAPKVPTSKTLLSGDIDIVTLLSTETEGQIFKSKGEARRSIESNAVSINKEKISLDLDLSSIQTLFGKYILVQVGKKKNYLLEIAY